MPEPTSPTSPHFEVLRPVEVYVVDRPHRRLWLHALLLVATVFTTLIVGTRLQINYLHGMPSFAFHDDVLPLFPVNLILADPSLLLLGVPFAATLMLILLTHEMGHFLLCRRHGVYATLPFFIPAPTLIGTFGAFIRIKSPIRSRAALLDIGIAGPIAGFVVSVAVLAVGLALSKPAAVGTGSELGYPLIFTLAHETMRMVGAAADAPLLALQLHPVAIAAWVGMFATALNLLPGGQLDGGHIVYALAPRAHRKVSLVTAVALVPLALFWIGWIVWATVLIVTGLRHPQVPAWPAPESRSRLLGIVALLLLALTFVPWPFPGLNQ